MAKLKVEYDKEVGPGSAAAQAARYSLDTEEGKQALGEIGIELFQWLALAFMRRSQMVSAERKMYRKAANQLLYSTDANTEKMKSLVDCWPHWRSKDDDWWSTPEGRVVSSFALSLETPSVSTTIVVNGSAFTTYMPQRSWLIRRILNGIDRVKETLLRTPE